MWLSEFYFSHSLAVWKYYFDEFNMIQFHVVFHMNIENEIAVNRTIYT